MKEVFICDDYLAEQNMQASYISVCHRAYFLQLPKIKLKSLVDIL